MLPELAVSYVIGASASISLSGLHVYLYKRKMKSQAFEQLQQNLLLCEKFWSEIESTIKSGSTTDVAQDSAKYIKSVLLSGALFAALTWLGFFLQLLMMISIRYLAVSRLEIRLFDSELSKKSVPAEQVRTIVDELTNLV